VSARILHDKWLSIFGPMDTLYVDCGPEFHGELLRLGDLYGFVIEFITVDCKHKAGKAERHGAISDAHEGDSGARHRV
jgi:hypothetical protein